MRRAAGVTANSSATEAAIRAIAPGLSTLRRIPMGAANAEPPPPGAGQNLRRALRLGEAPVLLFIGRLVAQKGVDDLLRALAILADDRPTACVVVVGDGPERAFLEKMARTLKINDRVRFTGLVEPSRVPDYLAAVDILVAPSKADRDGAAEGQSLVVIEAMLAGVPVIVSRSGGMVDAVRPGVTGLLVDEGAPAQIAKAVTRLLGDRELARRLARQARELAMQSCTADAAADAFSRLFAEVAPPPLSRRSDDAGP